MNNKTEILCSVNSCVFHKENHCCAEKISICCDNCIMPNSTHETACKSFKNEYQK